MQRIATKMLEIKKKDGSMLGLAMTKYSGKFGVLNYAVEGMMSSLGYTTRFAGTPCWPAGIDAQNYDMGDMWCNDPEDFVKAKYIIIWGANPARCSMHTMKYIYQAREKGAKVVVIDPLLTQTAAKADLYLRVRLVLMVRWRWVWHVIWWIKVWWTRISSTTIPMVTRNSKPICATALP